MRISTGFIAAGVATAAGVGIGAWTAFAKHQEQERLDADPKLRQRANAYADQASKELGFDVRQEMGDDPDKGARLSAYVATHEPPDGVSISEMRERTPYDMPDPDGPWVRGLGVGVPNASAGNGVLFLTGLLGGAAAITGALYLSESWNSPVMGDGKGLLGVGIGFGLLAGLAFGRQVGTKVLGNQGSDS